MCTDCGCHPHHPDDTPHTGDPGDGYASRRLLVEAAATAANDETARHNREAFRRQRLTALNLMSSPGAGKTSILERTIRHLAGRRPVYVIEGDQQTRNDAERIERAGATAVQINTGSGCHLEAGMVARAVERLDPLPGGLLFIENVGNLVCPAMFDLGEQAKVVIISVTEGDDKPEKYPYMFRAARLCLINKTDLLPYVDFDPGRCRQLARAVNPHITCIELSARTGEGFDAWLQWLSGLA